MLKMPLGKGFGN